MIDLRASSWHTPLLLLALGIMIILYSLVLSEARINAVKLEYLTRIVADQMVKQENFIKLVDAREKVINKTLGGRVNQDKLLERLDKRMMVIDRNTDRIDRFNAWLESAASK